MSIALYNDVCQNISKKLTKKYSTSFSLGIRMIDTKYRWAIYAVYGLVRVADEIVDTFHDQNKTKLLFEFREQTYQAMDNKMSTNPILHAFQLAAHQFGIDKALIDPFFESMAMDIDATKHTQISYENYIFGSAEVVGLMCLKVFCNNDQALYTKLEPPAKSLGSAFQKVNFLRDIQSDFEERGRTYFPGLNFEAITDKNKEDIIKDIEKDFDDAYKGIVALPMNCRFGVYTAYQYYKRLLKALSHQPIAYIKLNRISVPNTEKVGLLLRSYFVFKSGVLKNA